MEEYLMIHGRFQPFHNGHLSYLDQAYNLVSKHLIIAITNPTSRYFKEDCTDNHRHLKENNPLTFWERYEIIDRIVTNRFTNEKKITIIPFDIHNISDFTQIVPNKITQFVCNFDDWDYKKISLFQDTGYKVVFCMGDRITSGSEVRRRIHCGEDWEPLVPAETYNYLISQQDLINIHS